MRFLRDKDGNKIDVPKHYAAIRDGWFKPSSIAVDGLPDKCAVFAISHMLDQGHGENAKPFAEVAFTMDGVVVRDEDNNLFIPSETALRTLRLASTAFIHALNATVVEAFEDALKHSTPAGSA